MSFLAKLFLDGETYNVLYCSYRLTQSTDEIGKPSALPKGGSIVLTVESTGKHSLFDWMISATKNKSGNVVFYRRDAMSKLKELQFTDAFCVDYQETFRLEGTFPMQINIELSAKTIAMDDSEFTNAWSS